MRITEKIVRFEFYSATSTTLSATFTAITSNIEGSPPKVHNSYVPLILTAVGQRLKSPFTAAAAISGILAT